MAGEQKNSGKVKISFKQAMQMIYPYTKKRIMDQVSAVSIIVLYLILFQIFILGIPIAGASILAAGIGLVVIGLAFFMEGLTLGLMPLGEAAGVKLPQKSNLVSILIFAFILGIGATFAEPAISVLRAAGSSVKPWEAPLLFLMLNKNAGALVMSVGVGVGIAVLFGMLRFLYNWSLKPFIFVLISILLGFTVWGYFDKNIMYLTGLAWDCGGVTTGPVTVPLVLALGIGISRIVGGKDSGAGGGFGVVTLASAFPIITVFLLGIFFLGSTPAPMSPEDFAAPQNKSKVLSLFNDENELTAYIVRNMNAEHVVSYFDNDEDKFIDFLRKAYNDNDLTVKLFDTRSNMESWMVRNVDAQVLKNIVGDADYDKLNFSGSSAVKAEVINPFEILKRNFSGALQAIIPLSLFLLLVIIILLREKLSRFDEVVLGLIFAIIGMTIFSIGIELGLSRLGSQVGEKLPSSFKAIELPEQKKIIQNFDQEFVNTAIKTDGTVEKFFYSKNGNKFESLPYEEKYHNIDAKQYTFIPKIGPLFGGENGLGGILVVLIFAFIMGYSATLAEPALNALGATVEELTVGTFKKSLLMQTVAVGVGFGMFFGVAKIVWDFPLVFLLTPPYLLLLIITKISTEDFVNIGWDSAGVTTGPITVPLVLVMGLGIGGQVGVVEGFGILASASVFPILAVLSVGLYVNNRRKKVLKEAQ